MTELQTAIKEFNQASTLFDVTRIHQNYSSLQDINIEYFSALTKMRLGYKTEALPNIKNVAWDIISHIGESKYKYWDSSSIHSIGDSLYLLLKNYYKDEIPFNKLTFSLFNLSYLCLSNNIYNFPQTSCDSFYKRATLLQSGSIGKGMLSMGLVQGSLGLSTMSSPMLINDYYSSGQIYISEYNMASQGNNLIDRARRMHYELEDVSIEGKDASDYTIEEICGIGRIRHKQIYSVLLSKYANKEFVLNKEEFTGF